MGILPIKSWQSTQCLGGGDMEKKKILILSHGYMCQGILETAKMIGLEGEHIIAKPLDGSASVGEYLKEVRELLETCPEGSLILVDLFGGTPFNTLARIISEYPVYAVTGVNLPMVMEAWSSCDRLSGKELQKAVMDAGRDGIASINEFVENM